MSDQPTADAPATDAPAPDADAPKPTETVEFWKQKAREQESRAKANAKAAERLAEIENSQKTEAERTAERFRQLESEAQTARAEALRFKVAAKFGIGDEDADLFLSGSDEETLTRQAERLSARAGEARKNGNVVPREGTPTPAGDNPERQFAQELFASRD